MGIFGCIIYGLTLLTVGLIACIMPGLLKSAIRIRNDDKMDNAIYGV